MFASLFAAAAAAQDRALIVAIDTYAAPGLSGLPKSLAGNQAASIEKLLVEKLSYKAENVKILRNDEATKAAILKAIGTWLNPEGAGAGDNEPRKLVGLDESGALKKSPARKTRKSKKRTGPTKSYRSYLYFSGLGHFQPDTDGDEADGFDETLVPHDATAGQGRGEDTVANMISDDEIAAILATFSRRHVTLVLDTSHSGIVTRSSNLAARAVPGSLVPRLAGTVKNIAAGANVQAHKGEGAFVDVAIPHGNLTVWSAASPTQTALVAGPDAAPQGLFTLLYVEGLGEGKADANGNGIVANAELLRHVSDGSATYCAAFKERCEMGLRPRLDPPGAYGKAAWIDRNKVTRARERQLSLERLLDFLGPGQDSTLDIVQTPPSPLRVGGGGISYRVSSPVAGYLVLLNLTEQGELFQLYPNQYSSGGGEEAGLIQANAPLVVPEKTDGVTLTATEPGKGHIVAVMTPDPVKFGQAITSRAIAAVSSNEAIDVYLAGLAAALHRPVNANSAQVNTASARWSVRVLPYEIVVSPEVPGASARSN